MPKIASRDNPQTIREEIADLLKMNEEERSFLNSVSMTYLIQKLLDYTHSLEKEIAGQHKKKRKI